MITDPIAVFLVLATVVFVSVKLEERFKPFRSLGAALVTHPSPAVSAGPPLDSFPPVVVRTYPAPGEQGVDPRLSEVRVTFNKDMLTHDMWSFVYARPAMFPKIAGEIHYLADGRTCVLPVSLEPGTTYGIWINSQEHTAFRDTHHNRAVPFLLVFKTRD